MVEHIKKQIINTFKKEFLDCMVDIDPKYMRIIDENFWEQLLDMEIEINYGNRERTKRN